MEFNGATQNEKQWQVDHRNSILDSKKKKKSDRDHSRCDCQVCRKSEDKNLENQGRLEKKSSSCNGQTKAAAADDDDVYYWNIFLFKIKF